MQHSLYVFVLTKLIDFHSESQQITWLSSCTLCMEWAWYWSNLCWVTTLYFYLNFLTSVKLSCPPYLEIQLFPFLLSFLAWNSPFERETFQSFGVLEKFSCDFDFSCSKHTQVWGLNRWPLLWLNKLCCSLCPKKIIQFVTSITQPHQWIPQQFQSFSCPPWRWEEWC